MHKIKELLHKDDEDKKDTKHGDSHSSHSTHSDKDIKHGDHGHATTHSSESHHTSSDHHVKHGEIEHGGHTVHQTTTVHHEGGDHMKHSGEKHVYHEREVVKSGDIYREGVDPTLHREVAHEVRHEGEVKREMVGEATVIKEKIKEVELHKVQPVIHRDREQKEIRHVVEPHQKFEVKDTKVTHLEKDIDLGVRKEASTLETSRDIGHAPQMESTREFLATERQHQELPTRVEEHVHRKVEEHIHPVIYKETLVPKVTEETHHLYETVKERPIETYEVRSVTTHSGGDMRDAERSFFAEHASRGISTDTHSHGHTTHVVDSHSHGHDSHSHGHVHETGHVHHVDHSRGMETGHTCVQTCNHGTNLAPQPMVGHSQNIGAHHVAGAVPAGHNTAYDAALCNQCTDNKICSHGAKDKELMHKMNEKKIAQDEKLEKKEHK